MGGTYEEVAATETWYNQPWPHPEHYYVLPRLIKDSKPQADAKERRYFDALCDLNIYFYCDIHRPKEVGLEKFRESIRILVEAGVIKDGDDEGDVRKRYAMAIEWYAATVLPAGYFPQKDHWGAMLSWHLPLPSRFTWMPNSSKYG